MSSIKGQNGVGRRTYVSRVHTALVLASALASSACVTLPPNAPRAPQDPWESWNRGVYKVNDKVDRAFAKPVARTYVRYVPSPIRTGVSNVFDNFSTTTVMLNDALQGKFKAAANDLARFLLNSTLGIAGIFDPATSAGLAHNNEDFGQTLGVWGVHPGPFIELPIFGPSDLRDGPARLLDAYTSPQAYIGYKPLKYGLYGLSALNTRAGLLPLEDTLKNVFDPYAVIRDAYLQRRAYLVADGKVTEEEPLVDPEADNPDTPAKPPTDTTRSDKPPPNKPPPDQPPKKPPDQNP
jgi:phospholipid-binding lipoprotein MlaA